MKTITLKINERSKAGKAFLEMTNVLVKDSKGIEIISTESNAPIEKEYSYSPEFVAKIKKAEENIKKGKTTRLNPDDIWGSIL